MKKFALSAIAAAALFGGAAHAYTVGTFSNGLVVPNVIHSGAAETTAIGLINGGTKTAAVYWTFFNQNSGHEMDGCFTMTAKQYKSVTWNGLSTGKFKDARGYLVFSLGADSATPGVAAATCASATPVLTTDTEVSLAGNAFQVRAGADKDVAVVPVIDGPLTLDSATTNIARMTASSLVTVGGATTAIPSRLIYARYAVDADTTTKITVWSTGSHKGTHTVDIYNDNQERTSGNFALAEEELSWFDPAAMESRPTGYTDGFILWNPGVQAATGGAGTASLAALSGSVFVYSTIQAKSFGPAQTLLGAHVPN